MRRTRKASNSRIRARLMGLKPSSSREVTLLHNNWEEIDGRRFTQSRERKARSTSAKRERRQSSPSCGPGEGLKGSFCQPGLQRGLTCSGHLIIKHKRKRINGFDEVEARKGKSGWRGEVVVLVLSWGAFHDGNDCASQCTPKGGLWEVEEGNHEKEAQSRSQNVANFRKTPLYAQQ